MIKHILIAIISCFAISTQAQVYLSKIYNDILILGPNNVAPHCDEIAQSYVSELEGLYDLLIKEQEQLQLALNQYNGLKEPSKSQIFRASEQQGDLSLIETELTTIMQFKELWLKIVDQTPVKLELVDAIRSGQCAEIKTNHGVFPHNDYMVTLDKDIRTIKIIEHFQVEQKDSIPQWITKIDENCASRDTNDCKQWCFLNQPGGDVLVDFTNDIYRLSNSVIGSQFQYVPNTNYASRELTIDLNGSTIDIVNIVKSDTNMLLQLNGFETVECKQ